MPPNAYNAWKVVSLSPLPWPALAILSFLALFGVGLASWGLRKEPYFRRRGILILLRVSAGLAALFFLFEPGIRHLQLAQVKNRVAILVDRSVSMTFPTGRGEESRAQAVGKFLQQSDGALLRLSQRFNVEVLGFDPDLGPVSPGALMNESPKGGKTDLLGALTALKAGERGGAQKKVAGVLLLSDGADNAELQAGLAPGAAATLRDLDIPVSTVVVGQEGLADLAVENLRVDDFAFVRNSLTVEVELRGRAFKGRQVSVVLRREDQVVSDQRVTFRTDDDLETVPFTFTPDQTGRFVYTVSTPVYPEEAVAENNTRSFVLKVIRDRVRVLMVVGRPTWDERFLRGLLRGDPNVDLVSFYILRTTYDDARVRNQDRELSLIPFPIDEIFDKKLGTFDLVILQNFGYSDPSLSISMYEGNLRQYVHGGGAFLMIGGDRAFGEGRVSFPVLGEAMPVEPAHLPVNGEPFRPRLTPEGLRHPVTSLASGSRGTDAAWGALPPLAGLNLTRAKPGATVLLEHPFQTVDGKGAPVLALWEYGRGRSMALTTDSSWAWAFTAQATGQPTRDYDRFFGNAIRWLVRDPDLTTLKVNADPPVVESGRPVGAQVTARLPDYQPAAGAEVEVELLSAGGKGQIAMQRGVAGPDGTLRVEFGQVAPGAYKLRARAARSGQPLGEAEDAFSVRAVGTELSDAAVHPEILAEISRLTGGVHLDRLPAALPDFPVQDPPTVEVGRSKDEPLWDKWTYLLLAVLLLSVEWFLRRRFGYV